VLKINPAPTFALDAKLTVPGAAELATLALTVRHKGRDALKAWLEGSATQASDATLLGSVIVSWSGVLDTEGAEVPFSQTALEKVLDAYPAARDELFSQYLQALTESRRKN
jgi:hypothetical protein